MVAERAASGVARRRPPGLGLEWWAGVRIAFGVIWLIDGLLEWQPADFQGLGMVFMPGATDIQSWPLYVLVSVMLLKALPAARQYRRSYPLLP